jgi:hypothetical protein
MPKRSSGKAHKNALNMIFWDVASQRPQSKKNFMFRRKFAPFRAHAESLTDRAFTA